MTRLARAWSTMLGAFPLAVVAAVVPAAASAVCGVAAQGSGQVRCATLEEPPSVIAEPDTIAVPEGTSASFTVRLSQAPARTVFLGIAIRGTGIWASPPVSLVFTPTNWSTPQSYSVYSVPDPDAVDDVATFILSVPDYVSDKVVLVQVDDD
ncbi:hypothetical protein ACIBF5_29665 [Micromonospora sp. NPDC050417]|uniref:hypothetical protein n=1 Tax=Micromonospora sp. NPDC050417 TaxID=3364280 RepID=UPI0037AF93AD